VGGETPLRRALVLRPRRRDVSRPHRGGRARRPRAGRSAAPLCADSARRLPGAGPRAPRRAAAHHRGDPLRREPATGLPLPPPLPAGDGGLLTRDAALDAGLGRRRRRLPPARLSYIISAIQASPSSGRPAQAAPKPAQGTGMSSRVPNTAHRAAPAVGWSMGGLMGVHLSPPATRKNSVVLQSKASVRLVSV